MIIIIIIIIRLKLERMAILKDQAEELMAIMVNNIYYI
jgi:hypothetical protein